MKNVKLAYKPNQTFKIISVDGVFATLEDVQTKKRLITDFSLCEVVETVETVEVTKQNINKQAMALAHSIKAAYSSFRAALLVAYKVLKDSDERLKVLKGLSTAQLKLSALSNQKWVACFDAWVAIWNLDYLD